MTDLRSPPSEIEIAEAVNCVSAGGRDNQVVQVLRRLAFQRDALLTEIARLKRGDFTEDEFQNLCHNFDASDIERFKQGCVDYQKQLFDEKAQSEPKTGPPWSAEAVTACSGLRKAKGITEALPPEQQESLLQAAMSTNMTKRTPLSRPGETG